MNFLYYTTLFLFFFICVILVLLILIQKGRGGGLASAFGGGGGNTAFGSKTGDVLTWATSIVFGVFLLLAVALNLMINNRAGMPNWPTRAAIPVNSGTTSLPKAVTPDPGLPETTQPANRPATTQP